MRRWPGKSALLAVGAASSWLTACGLGGAGPAAKPAAPIPSTASAAPQPAPSVRAVAGQLSPSGTVVLPTTSQLSAPSSNVVWALVAGRLLFRSSDRGGGWQQQGLPPGLLGNLEVAFASEREGWLLTVGSAATQCMLQTISISHTSDGGASWEPLGSSGILDSQCKSALSFTDAAHGFLGAWDQNHPPVIYRTSDGGRTWAPSLPLPDPPGFTTQVGGHSLTAGEVRAFGPSLLLWAQGPDRLSYAFRSLGGGATWTYLSTTPNASGAAAFVTATRWLDVDAPGQSQETTDSGATWRPYPTDYAQAAGVAPVVLFGDSQVGYAAVRGSIQVSRDGGAHWTLIHTPGT